MTFIIPPTEKQIQYAKYKWEFLRRNPSYVKEWEELQGTLEKLENQYKHITENEDWTGGEEEFIEYKSKEKEIKWEFCERWNISSPRLPPDLSYDELAKMTAEFLIYMSLAPIKNLPIRELTLSTYLADRDEWGRPIDMRRATVVEKTFMSWSDTLAEDGKIRLEIDLSYSLNRLVTAFEAFVREWQEKLQSHWKFIEREEPRETLITKLHYGNFDDYLKVYDLRQESKSWSKIKKLLNLNSLQTARNHYCAACERIEKGLDTHTD